MLRLSPCGLTVPQAFTLLGLRAGLTVGEIADAMGVSPANVSVFRSRAVANVLAHRLMAYSGWEEGYREDCRRGRRIPLYPPVHFSEVQPLITSG